MSWCNAHRAEHNECDHPHGAFHAHCTTQVWAPDRHTSVNNLAFSAYALSQQRIEDFINALAAADDPNDIDAQANAALVANLNISSLTRYEREYIEREVAKRWRT